MILPGSLFSPGDASDPAYRNLRSSTHAEAKEGKAFAERLWREYHLYADANFLTEVRSNFHARFWEMYLTCALLQHRKEKGYSVSCPKRKKTGGPDILVEYADVRIWIEAVTATDGEPCRSDSIVEPMPGQGFSVPEEKIILRYSNAIAEKHKKYLDYRAKGIASEKDAYVIAVNGYPLSYRWADAEMPRVLKSVFPLGHLEVKFDKTSTKVVETRHQFRPDILKGTGSPVSTRTFLSDEYTGISAVMHSYANACMAFDLGVDFLIVHNPRAAYPVPLGLIPVTREYTATATEGGYLLTVAAHKAET